MQRNYGFVRLYRDITDWGWYQNPNTFRVFIHCILKANYTEKEWQGIKIPVGSFVTSYEHLAKELKLTKRQIETAIKHLVLSHNLLYKGTNKYSIITVVNYTNYQHDVTQKDKQTHNKCETNAKQMCTTNKWNKGIKEERNYNTTEIFKKLKEKYERDGHL